MRPIDADKMIVGLYGSDEDVYDRREIVEILEDQPTVQTGPRWIPVSERLPDKKFKSYLVTLKALAGYEEVVFDKVTHMMYFGTDGVNWAFEWYNKERVIEVVAWMPLPEPYKEDAE